MKKPILLLVILGILGGFATSCKGPQGAEGAMGPQGAQGAPGTPGEKGDKGDKGETGNINVIQVTYNELRAELPNDLALTLPATITTDIIEKSLFYVYVKQTIKVSETVSNSYWLPIPGEILNGNRYNFYIHPGNGQTRPGLFLRRIVNFQPGGDFFEVIRVLVVPSANQVNGRRAAVDYSNYEEVRKTYNLPE
jgi:hypothetical protein